MPDKFDWKGKKVSKRKFTKDSSPEVKRIRRTSSRVIERQLDDKDRVIGHVHTEGDDPEPHMSFGGQNLEHSYGLYGERKRKKKKKK